MLMPLLYGILGSGLDFEIVDSDIMWRAFVVMIVGTIVRVPLSYISVIKADLNYKEKLFISIAWIPKATVQAALGGVILGIIDQKNLETTFYRYGQSILAITLLSILITAPLGALLIGLLGKKLLKQGNPATMDEELSSANIDKYEGRHVDYLYLRHVIPNKIVKVVILSPENRLKSKKSRSMSADSDEHTPVSSVSML
jgi:solute carrier family 9B (sodium/hydrogen exchanger), member 1/2